MAGMEFRQASQDLPEFNRYCVKQMATTLEIS